MLCSPAIQARCCCCSSHCFFYFFSIRHTTVHTDGVFFSVWGPTLCWQMIDLTEGCCVFLMCAPVSRSAQKVVPCSSIILASFQHWQQSPQSCKLCYKGIILHSTVPNNNVPFNFDCKCTVCRGNGACPIQQWRYIFCSRLFSLNCDYWLMTVTIEAYNHRLCSFFPLCFRSMGRPEQQYRYRQH